MLEFGVLSIFLDMVLDSCSDETKRVTCDALVKFGQYGMVVPDQFFGLVIDFDLDDIRLVLSEAGYLQKLAKRAQSHVPNTRDGATMALVDLGKVQGAGGVMLSYFFGQKLKVTQRCGRP